MTDAERIEVAQQIVGQIDQLIEQLRGLDNLWNAHDKHGEWDAIPHACTVTRLHARADVAGSALYGVRAALTVGLDVPEPVDVVPAS